MIRPLSTDELTQSTPQLRLVDAPLRSFDEAQDLGSLDVQTISSRRAGHRHSQHGPVIDPNNTITRLGFKNIARRMRKYSIKSSEVSQAYFMKDLKERLDQFWEKNDCLLSEAVFLIRMGLYYGPDQPWMRISKEDLDAIADQMDTILAKREPMTDDLDDLDDELEDRGYCTQVVDLSPAWIEEA